jgi:hypothetical protein
VPPLPRASPSLPLLNAAASVTPPCPTCNAADSVAPLTVTEVDRAVRYWSCSRCGLTWGTRDFNVQCS